MGKNLGGIGSIGRISNKEIFFDTVYVLLLLFACWPGFFVGNRAEPFILGMPFFLIYQFLITVVMVLFFIIQFVLDDKAGGMEFEVDPDYDYIKDKDKYF